MNENRKVVDEKAANIGLVEPKQPIKVTADSMVLGYRLGDLIAVKKMVDERGLDVQALASAIRYGYDLAMTDVEKAMTKMASADNENKSDNNTDEEK